MVHMLGSRLAFFICAIFQHVFRSYFS
uniref:Uncharacterized protein n=1 Tax=Arundo donax TaxID=35708 RepID=A0A0A9GXT7_ARUDO